MFAVSVKITPSPTTLTLRVFEIQKSAKLKLVILMFGHFWRGGKSILLGCVCPIFERPKSPETMCLHVDLATIVVLDVFGELAAREVHARKELLYLAHL